MLALIIFRYNIPQRYASLHKNEEASLSNKDDYALLVFLTKCVVENPSIYCKDFEHKGLFADDINHIFELRKVHHQKGTGCDKIVVDR